MRQPVAATLADAEALGLLADPTRRRLYGLVASCSRPVSRRDAAEAAGIERALAAYHLDKLVELGLLEATYQRPPERAGPGAGRPPKVYRRAQRDFTATTPARDYTLLADVLLEAASHGDAKTQAAIERAARDVGCELGAAAHARTASLEDVLRERGYEPAGAAEGRLLRLGNCPFDRLAARRPELVCALNLALVQGLLAGLGCQREEAVLDPQPGRCCVSIRR
jgi:predicted ArsR family transcriptional regulator